MTFDGMASSDDGSVETVDSFKTTLYDMQKSRRKLVDDLLHCEHAKAEDIEALRSTHSLLTDMRTSDYQRMLASTSQRFSVNLKDEIFGLEKDIVFLEGIQKNGMTGDVFTRVDLPKILAPYHPVSEAAFNAELEETIAFLTRLADIPEGTPKVAFITDWDGTMKNYCSQYATNLQPVYSAVAMARYAHECRLCAVLTAGPLRGPGILDLTALPIDGDVVFSGSWGREWWMNGRRLKKNEDILEEQDDALTRFSDSVRELVGEGRFSQFALVGSGVQKKVDRLTLGVQTVCNQVDTELSTTYQDSIQELMHRADPNKQHLKYDGHNKLEVEVCIKSSDGTIWDKGNGVEVLLTKTGKNLDEGRVLIAGDTFSDLPMLKYAVEHNPEGTYALFVGLNDTLKEEVRSMVGDSSRVCFIACPDIFHAALSRILPAQEEVD